MINLYNMDCMEALQAAPDNYWDLAIVDPPYGINFSNKVREKCIKNWDVKIPNTHYFSELKRVSKNCIIWGANYFPCLWDKGCRGFIFWNKHVNNSNMNSAGELAYTTFKQPAQYFYYAWNGLADGIRGRNKTQKTIHPTQKPIALYTWLLSKYSKKGDKILDTHLGSGSSAIAAHKAGYDFWGYEIDKDYFKAASKRLKEAQRQLLLF